MWHTYPLILEHYDRTKQSVTSIISLIQSLLNPSTFLYISYFDIHYSFERLGVICRHGATDTKEPNGLSVKANRLDESNGVLIYF